MAECHSRGRFRKLSFSISAFQVRLPTRRSQGHTSEAPFVLYLCAIRTSLQRNGSKVAAVGVRFISPLRWLVSGPFVWCYRRWSSFCSSRRREDFVVYQGTTLVVPQTTENMLGFSPCGKPFHFQRAATVILGPNSFPATELGCPTSRSFFARCGATTALNPKLCGRPTSREKRARCAPVFELITYGPF